MYLKGITWDHERGYTPLISVTEEFCKKYPGLTITWAKRSLKDFGDYPISELVKLYDFIMIDHPFMAEAYEEGLLVVLDDLIGEEHIRMLQKESVGLSFESYYVNGHLQALPVDAATQVSAVNREKLGQLGLSIPCTFEDIFRLQERAGKGCVATAMAATDIFSIFLSFVAQQCGKQYFDLETGISMEYGEKAVSYVRQLASISCPDTYDMNPIQLLDKMSSEGQILYTPYVYGYTNYARDGFRKHVLEFFDAPLLYEKAKVSTQLGGVGISITNRVSKEQLPVAVEFVKYLTQPEIQMGIYTCKDGQPAALSAWKDDENNRMTHNFFKNTLKTLETSFVRPKITKWNTFQEEASVLLHQEIKSNMQAKAIVEQFNLLYKKICVKA